MTTDKKITIAFVYDAIYPYIKGGAERRYFEIGKRLVLHGYDVHLYGMKLWKGPDVIKREGMTFHGICPTKNLYKHTGKRSISQAIYFGLNCFKLINEDFDVIDCCGFPYFSLFSCKAICILKRKKLYSTWHEVWGINYWKEYIGILAPFGYFIEKLAVKMPDVIISVSEMTARKIKNELHFNKKIVVSPNGIDIEHINSIKPSLTKSDIIYAGRLMDFKHIDVLIKTVALLKKKLPSISCIIIGDGPEKIKLEKLAKELGLEENIKFFGFLKHHDEVYGYMKSSNVFILPSTREGFGIAILEANACDLKAITIDNRNNAAVELINEHTGELSKLDDKSLSRHISNVLQTTDDKSEKKEVREHYSWDVITKSIDTIYNL